MYRLLILMLFFSIQLSATTNVEINSNEEIMSKITTDDPAERLIELLSEKITLTEEQKAEIRQIAPTYQLTGSATEEYRERVRQFKRHVRDKVLTPRQVAQFKS